LSKVNFVSNYYVTFFVEGINEKDSQSYKVMLTDIGRQSVLGSKLSKKEFEQLSIAYNIMSSASHNYRLKLYIDELAQKGFFNYNEYEFHQNGDIRKRGITKANLAYEIGRQSVIIGSAWKGYRSSIYQGLCTGRIYPVAHGSR
jgi:hypothetical protein